MLQFIGVDGVEDPIKSKDWVEYHGNVVDPGVFVAQDIAEKWMFCVRIAETWIMSVRFGKDAEANTYSNPCIDPIQLHQLESSYDMDIRMMTYSSKLS